MCREDGIARVASTGLAAVCYLPIEAVDRAISVLSSPDKRSRSVADEGRRIERVDGGYRVINYSKYREQSTTDYHRCKKRIVRQNALNASKSEVVLGHSSDVLGLSASASASASALGECEGGESGGVLGRSRKMARPTVEEVAVYCRERGNKVDAQRFVDFYESKGWVVGKSPMRSWQAAVRTWERNTGGAVRAPAERAAGYHRILRNGEPVNG